MLDMEKVIKDLEFCVNGRYKVELSLATKILALLKEQEAIKPKIDAFGHPYCPKYKILVYETWKFCPHCGQAVKCNE